MNHNKWYVSSGYNRDEVDIVVKIIKTLGESHTILIGQPFYYLSELTENMLEASMDIFFDTYIQNLLYMGHITDMNEFERRMRNVFLRKYGNNEANVDFINNGNFSIQKMLEKFSDIDEETLYELKYTLMKNLNNTSDIIETRFSEDKVRFRKVHDMSLSHRHKLDGQEFRVDPYVETIYTWLELSTEENIREKGITFWELIYGHYTDLHLIITDDLSEISNFRYYINTFWLSESGITVAVNDNHNKLHEFAEKLDEICGEERRFVKWSDEVLNYLRLN